jgi:hypothetical protein
VVGPASATAGDNTSPTPSRCRTAVPPTPRTSR